MSLPPRVRRIVARVAPFAALSLLVSAVSVVATRRAAADGVPGSPLVYSGYLEDAAGTPANGTLPMVVAVFDAETAGAALCTTTASVAVSRGRFSMPLDLACNASVKSGPDRWSELTVEGVMLPRQRIGATPYAHEAGRASAASGPLKAQLDDLGGATAKANEAKTTANEAKATANEAKTTANEAKASANDAKAAGDAGKAAADAAAARLAGGTAFFKGGNNGTVSCDTYCAGPNWGPVGACIAAKAAGTQSYIACDVILQNYGAADCLCLKF